MHFIFRLSCLFLALIFAALVSQPLQAKQLDRVRIAPVQIALRAGPGTRFEEVAMAYKGDELPVLDRRGSWLLLKLPNPRGAKSGWLMAAFTDPIEDLDQPDRADRRGNPKAGARERPRPNAGPLQFHDGNLRAQVDALQCRSSRQIDGRSAMLHCNATLNVAVELPPRLSAYYADSVTILCEVRIARQPRDLAQQTALVVPLRNGRGNGFGQFALDLYSDGTRDFSPNITALRCHPA